MTLKIANLTILASIVAVSSAAFAGPARVKPETKVETIVKEGVKPTLGANPSASTAGNAFAKTGKLAPIQATGQTCQNIVADASKAMPDSSLSQEVTKYAGILGNKVQGCAAGTKVDDKIALQNLGYSIIMLGKAVEAGQINVNQINTANVAAALQYAFKQQGQELDKNTALVNAGKLSKGECQFFNVSAN